MNPITKNKSLVAIIIFLLVSNIAMLVFFLMLGSSPKKEHSRREMVGNFLKKDIGFSQSQMDSYEKMHKEQWDSMKQYFDRVRTAKDSLYNLLYSSANDTVVAQAAEVIGQQQAALDQRMFKNLANVRGLCTPEQLPKFDTSFRTVVSKMIGHNRKPDSKDK